MRTGLATDFTDERRLRTDLRCPILDLVVVFIVWNLRDRGRELKGTGLVLDLAPKRLSQTEEAAGGNGGHVALRQFGFDLAQLFSQGIDTGIARGKPLFLERFNDDGALILDVELELSAPTNERGLGDLQILGDTAKLQPSARRKTKRCCFSMSFIAALLYTRFQSDDGEVSLPAILT